MVESMANSTNNENINRNSSSWLQSTFYAVWTVIGIVLLALISVGIFGSDTWVENLNLAATTEVEQTEQAPPQPQEAPPQPAEPTEDQLACVGEELGEERLAELEQGQQATEEEAMIIQQCLQG